MTLKAMRRSAQKLEQEPCLKILENGSYGILALSNPQGSYPIQIPLNYVLIDDTIYFHCAKQGEKLEAIKANPSASFCVVSAWDVISEKLTTAYESVLCYGRMTVLRDESKRAPLLALCEKYAPMMDKEQIERSIDASFDHVLVLALKIEEISGKQGKERRKSQPDISCSL